MDGEGNAYVTGYTAARTSPPLNAFQPTFGGGGDALRDQAERERGRLSTAPTSAAAGYDVGQGIAVDGSGNAYVTGYTTGGFPTLNAAQGRTVVAATMPL